jgi:hypothetical protein
MPDKSLAREQQQISMKIFCEKKTFFFICIRLDQNPSKSKSLSHLKIFFSSLTPVIAHLLIVYIMLPTH